MWYFTWILGLGFAVLLAVVNALWLESQEARLLQAQADLQAKAEPAQLQGET